jgi:hypothetical protein
MTGQTSPRDFLNPTAAILLPAGQAFVSALAIGSTVTSLAILAKAPQPLAIGGVAAGVGLGAAWLLGLSWWRERVEGLKPEPELVYPAESTQLQLSIDWDEGRAGIFDDLNVTDEMFIQWACEVAQGKSLGENHHTGSAGAFSKGAYHQFVDRLEFHGFVRQKSKARTAGLMLTGKGRAVCREVLRHYGAHDGTSPTRQRYLPAR